MKIKVIITEEDLKKMKLTKEKLSEMVLLQLDDIIVNDMRISYQTEIEVETIIDLEV